MADDRTNGFPTVKIQLIDDSGLCHLYIDDKTGIGNIEELNGYQKFELKGHLSIIWMTFRGMIDSSTTPDYAPPKDGSYTTEMAKSAVCTAMNIPILITDITNMEKWGDAVAEPTSNAKIALHS